MKDSYRHDMVAPQEAKVSVGVVQAISRLKWNRKCAKRISSRRWVTLPAWKYDLVRGIYYKKANACPILSQPHHADPHVGSEVLRSADATQ